MSWGGLLALVREARTAPARPAQDEWGTPPPRPTHLGSGRQFADLQALLKEQASPWAELDTWGPPPAATPRGGDGHWWDDLRTYLAATGVRAVVGVECPNDGSLLLPFGGRLQCPFDGWRGTAEQARPAGPRRPASAGYGLTPYGTGSYGE